MANREDLKRWTVEALRDNGGSALMIVVSKHIWAHHQKELEESGDYFFKWQYDLRWAANVLRKEGVLEDTPRGKPWTLAR